MSGSRQFPDRPNVHGTTETTVPLAATVLLGFSIAFIGLAATADFPFVHWQWLPFVLTTKVLASFFFALAAVVFLFSTLACCHGQSYNYLALSSEARQYWGFESMNPTQRKAYIRLRMNQWQRWHSRAANSFNAGLLIVLIGAGIFLATLGAGIWNPLGSCYRRISLVGAYESLNLLQFFYAVAHPLTLRQLSRRYNNIRVILVGFKT